jgi:hypothetical protein
LRKGFFFITGNRCLETGNAFLEKYEAEGNFA